MAFITDAKLTISHDHQKKTATPVVICKIKFTLLELCLMKTCPQRWFKLKCQLWGEDPGSDQFLYTYPSVYYFPDQTPSETETKEFKDTVGEGY